ncbi:MAG TPA: hypothetical protein VKZ60_12345 [Chloroflexota bacterium]|nr:hypothetical protein [Chloroflexota bacterium]
MSEATPPPGNEARGSQVPQLALLYRKVLAGDCGVAQVWFDQRVLDRYRGQAGYRVLRSNSAGRLRAPAGWTLDFGIADGDRLIHAAAADLAQRLPPAERQHWLEHVVTPPVSRVFLTMRLGAGSCVDDGEIRDW